MKIQTIITPKNIYYFRDRGFAKSVIEENGFHNYSLHEDEVTEEQFKIMWSIGRGQKIDEDYNTTPQTGCVCDDCIKARKAQK